MPVPDDDIHSMVIGEGNPKRVFALTPRELYVTTDMGESWEPMGTKRYVNAENSGHYQRWLAHKPDDHRVMFMGTGSFNVGDSGNIFRSKDFGESWEPVDLSKHTNSTVFGIHTNAAEPDRVVACSVNGEVWASDDVGRHLAFDPADFRRVELHRVAAQLGPTSGRSTRQRACRPAWVAR